MASPSLASTRRTLASARAKRLFLQGGFVEHRTIERHAVVAWSYGSPRFYTPSPANALERIIIFDKGQASYSFRSGFIVLRLVVNRLV